MGKEADSGPSAWTSRNLMKAIVTALFNRSRRRGSWITYMIHVMQPHTIMSSDDQLLTKAFRSFPEGVGASKLSDLLTVEAKWV